MKRFIVILILGGISFVLAVIAIVHDINLSKQYMGDSKYAFVCVQQNEFYELKDEEYVKGTYLVENDQVSSETISNQCIDTSLIIVDFKVIDIFGIDGELSQNDKNGCIISNNLSYKLFGNQHSIGLIVVSKGKEYVVRDVINTEEAVMIIQNEDNVAGDHALLKPKSISGIILDTSNESYRGETVERLCGYQNIDIHNYYYVSDYLHLLPNVQLPSKWSDFDYWEEVSRELCNVSERRLYANKDVVEIFYYRIRQQLWKYRNMSVVFIIVFFYIVLQFTGNYRNCKCMKETTGKQ